MPDLRIIIAGAVIGLIITLLMLVIGLLFFFQRRNTREYAIGAGLLAGCGFHLVVIVSISCAAVVLG